MGKQHLFQKQKTTTTTGLGETAGGGRSSRPVLSVYGLTPSLKPLNSTSTVEKILLALKQIRIDLHMDRMKESNRDCKGFHLDSELFNPAPLF